MSSIFSITFTTVNGQQSDAVIYIGMEKAVRVAAASEVSCYGFRGYDLEQVGHSEYTAKEGDRIKVIGG
jgi:hypothetical protein